MSVKVSVLMPIYRTKESYLRTAIESILNQTFTDFEFLILDDCPFDDREEIVKSYIDPRIIYLKNETNLGITPSRNKLIELAKGEYLAVMDHDDISLPMRFEKQVAYLDAHPNVGVVGCLTKTFPYRLDLCHPEKDEEIKMALTYRCAILHPASMMRKSVLMDNNIRYEKRYSPSEDYCMWIRLMDCTDFYNIQEILFRYRYYKNNTTHRQINKMDAVAEELFCIVQKKHPKLYAKASKKKYRWSFFGFEKGPVRKFKKKQIQKKLNYHSEIILKKPMLVHAHIFYPDLWPELKTYIQNISPYPFDLYVTMVQKYPDIEDDIHNVFPKAHIEVVENRGYDVGPFIHILNKIDLDNYDYVIKIHTKGTKTTAKKFRGLKGGQWREELLSFLQSHETLTSYLNSFQQSSLGMTGGYKCLITRDNYYVGPECQKRIEEFIIQNGLSFINFSFVAGTCFLCRSSVLRPIQTLRLKISDFEVPGEKEVHSLAHVFERMFGYYTAFMGFECANYLVPRWKQKLFIFIKDTIPSYSLFCSRYLGQYITYKISKLKTKRKGF